MMLGHCINDHVTSYIVYWSSLLINLVLKGWVCKKGMLAAEATFKSLVEGSSMELYWENLKKSWIWEELQKARNYRPVCGDFIVAFSEQTYICLNF